ncbi:MAG TPA: serine/threonine-protein kinase [Anaerolineales bacterium]
MPLPLKKEEVLRGRYKVRERIGQGGMGSIYLADDLRLEGRLCALKEVEYDRALPPKILDEAREQFLREATVLARLDHPNLPKVSDFFSNGPRDYLAMDYVPGKDLRELILAARRNKTFLDENEVLGWANQLADALAYLHRQDPPIIHRDIKPSNLKITPSGVLKLVDFGLVKLLVPEEVTITIIQGQGTALYTPLEQYGGDDAHTDVRADIYSFGATLYHLLTNEPPIEARRRFLRPNSLLPIRQINPAVTLRTERSVQWAMALHPDERPESMQIFAEVLFGHRDFSTGPMPKRPSYRSLWEFAVAPPESALLWASAGLLLISLIATLTHQ